MDKIKAQNKPLKKRKFKGNIKDRGIYTDDLGDELIAMFKKGKTRANFCAWLEIPESTFDDWLRKKPEFAAAYEQAQTAAKSWYDDLARAHIIEEYQGPRLNMGLYNRIQNLRFDQPYQRKLKIEGIAKAKTIQEKFDAVLQQVEEGKLTGVEIQSITTLFDQAVKVGKYDELEKRLAQIEESQKIGVDTGEFQEAEEIDYLRED